ncbi:hypothetical protein ACMGEE_17255 [Erwinia sp. DT-104]|uniref:hypothetical protein n=1 Tax=Erwinia sp. DT-104 TaxID=3396161 RepID=UPI003F1B88ED
MNASVARPEPLPVSAPPVDRVLSAGHPTLFGLEHVLVCRAAGHRHGVWHSR